MEINVEEEYKKLISYIQEEGDDSKDLSSHLYILKMKSKESLSKVIESVFRYYEENLKHMSKKEYSSLVYMLTFSDDETKLYASKVIIDLLSFENNSQQSKSTEDDLDFSIDKLDNSSTYRINNLIFTLETSNRDIRNRVVNENIRSICLLIMQDSNRDMCNADEIFENLSPEAQKELVDCILDNASLLRKTFLESKLGFINNILNFLSDSVIEEKAPELKKIISLYNDSEYTQEFAKEITDRIDSVHDKEKFYSKLISLPVEDLLILQDSEIIGYINYAFEQDKYAFTDNDNIATLFQFASSHAKIKVKTEFYKRKSKDIPDMSKYEEFIRKSSDMSDEMFESFMQDLKDYRNCEDMFPEEYCDYLVKQKMNSNSPLNRNLDKYFSVFKRSFEDKAQYILRRDDIYSYTVCVNSELNEDNLGQKGYRYIKFNEEEVRNLSENNMHPLNTMFHECRHVLQDRRIIQGEGITASEYRIIKEAIIREKDKKYYSRNYWYMFNEVDARISGAKGAYLYLKELGFEEKKILDMDSSDFFECYAEKYMKTRKELDDAYIKKDSDGHYKNFNIIFYRILHKNLEFLDAFPILKLEFNENGDRRHAFDILRDYETEVKETRLNPDRRKNSKIGILSSILRNRGPVLNEYTIEDSYSLLDFETDEKAVKFHRDIIIENQLLKAIDSFGKKGEIYTFTGETSEEASKHFRELVNNLQEFVRRNPDEPICKKIIEKIEPYVQRDDFKTGEVELLARIDEEVNPVERQEGFTVMESMTKEIGDKTIEDKVKDE